MARLLRWLVGLALGLVAFTALWALAYRWIDPPITWIQARDRIDGVEVRREWVGLDRIAPAMPRAVIGAEDANFCIHDGFDIGAIQAAMQANEEGGRLRGGSTISQQVAKNVFLWPERSWARKALEAWFTVLIEALWGKPRIMEVYLNVSEMGRGVYGVEAAARRYFGKPAAKLTRQEAARLAAILPQPIKRDAADPGRQTRRYARNIQKRIRVVQREGIDACLRA